MQEVDIVEAAVEQFNEQTGLGATLTFPTRDGKKEIDGQLRLPLTNTQFNIECKKWINKANQQRQLVGITLNDLEACTILMTEYINPNLAEQLKEQGIQFLDVAGNAYINQLPIYIDIQGKKLNKPHKEVALAKQVGKAFQPKGMKVILMLLINPELVNSTMRTIAKQAEVALGTVKQVIDDLIYQGFIIEKGKKGKVLENRKALLEKWLDAYPANLEAKLHQTLFVADAPEQLKTLDIDIYGGLWGGELAAERYDHYLKAKDFLVYLPAEQKQAFLKKTRLRKPANNEVLHHRVIVVEPLVNLNKIKGEQTDLVHPLLVYANLMTSTDTRNIDAAQRLYDNYLA